VTDVVAATAFVQGTTIGGAALAGEMAAGAAGGCKCRLFSPHLFRGKVALVWKMADNLIPSRAVMIPVRLLVPGTLNAFQISIFSLASFTAATIE
jgi:hypothetical protein